MRDFYDVCVNDLSITTTFVAAMLSGPGQFAENEANEVNFREIP